MIKISQLITQRYFFALLILIYIATVTSGCNYLPDGKICFDSSLDSPW